MGIEISAVICTLNRVKYLRKAIKSLIHQTIVKDLYEIIIVDNGSTDSTRDLVINEFNLIGNLKYIHEPVPGLSQARNTGWRKAVGQYVAYLDDDAIAYPYWLEKILYVFQTQKPKPACVGGRIEPIWESLRPPWLSDSIISCIGVLDGPAEPITVEGDNWLGGGNSAYSVPVLRTIGGFPINLGRKGKKLLSNEENLVRHKLKEKGYSCFYHPEVAIRHHIHKSRLNRWWFMRRWYWQGISDAITKIHLESLTSAERLKIAAFSLICLIRSFRYQKRLFLSSDVSDRFALRCGIILQLGFIRGLLI